MSVLMRCFQRAARIVPPPRCGGMFGAEQLGRYRVDDAALRAPQAGCGFGKRQGLHGLSARGGGVAKALIWRIHSGGTAPWRRAARASCRQVKGPSVWALTRSSKEASLMSTVAMDRWRRVGLSARRAW